MNMLNRLAVLACLCAVGDAATKKKDGFQKIPQFYTSTDCTGAIDAESKLWSMAAKDGVDVMPFATPGAYLQGWAFNRCLNTSTTSYSLQIAVNGTACATDSANQVQLLYYATDKRCGGVPDVVPLTANQCVRYARGSVRLTTEVSLSDLCIATNYLTIAASGGMRTELWFADAQCTGTPSSVSNESYAEKDCGAQPQCDGCCPEYDKCVRERNKFEFPLQACQRKGDTWQFGLKIRSYSDANCSTALPTIIDSVVEMGKCITANLSAVGVAGNNASARFMFIAPMTVNVHCGFLEMALRNNIDPNVVTWGELNAGGAVVPTMLVLVVLLAALL